MGHQYQAVSAASAAGDGDRSLLTLGITYQAPLICPLGDLEGLPDCWPILAVWAAEAAGDGDRSLLTPGTAVDGLWHRKGPAEKKK